MNEGEKFDKLKKSISKDVKIIKEINSFLVDFNEEDTEEEKMILSQFKSLKNSLRKENRNISKILKDISLAKPLPQQINLRKEISHEFKPENKKVEEVKGMAPINLRDKSLKRKGDTEKVEGKKDKNIIGKSRLSTKIFSGLSKYLLGKKRFKKIQEDLIKANMKFLPKVYISIMFFSTLLASVISIFILIILLFFNLSFVLPFITLANGEILTRFLKFFWILLVIPIGTFIFMYFYPTLEKNSLERKINQELPFATINMSAISGSLVDPTKIFSIIILTKEYPSIEKEFVKIINGINVLGKDLITVLREGAISSPSKKLSDLFNGLATIINSGGDLSKFFEERAKSLLFEYKIDQEKETKSAETFMDIYISVVIAAPMILMLLMIMIQISGLGISLSISAITLMIILGVSLINIVFLTFLHLKQPKN